MRRYLSHYGLVTTHGAMDRGQHGAVGQQAIAWFNVDLSLCVCGGGDGGGGGVCVWVGGWVGGGGGGGLDPPPNFSLPTPAPFFRVPLPKIQSPCPPCSPTSLMGSYGIHLGVVAWEMLRISICKMSVKVTAKSPRGHSIRNMNSKWSSLFTIQAETKWPTVWHGYSVYHFSRFPTLELAKNSP